MSFLSWFLGGRSAGNLSEGKVGTYLLRRSKEGQAELEAAAKRDGAAGLPGQYDANLSQYEQRVVQQAGQWMTNTAGDCRKRDAVVYPRFVKARADFRNALRQYEQKKKELGDRPVDIQMRWAIYWPLMLVMALSEAGVNALAFEALLPDAPIIAWVTAAVLAIVLVIAAHSVGAAIQQGRGKKWAATAGIASILMTFGLAYFRFAYVEFDNTSELGALLARPKLDAHMVTGFFLVFNVLFFIVAAWLSAKLHDKDQTYEQRYKHYLRTREVLVAEKQRRDMNQTEWLRVARDEEGLHRTLITQYRDLNMQEREIKATPRVWIDKPPETLVKVNEADFELADNECKFESELEGA